MVEAGHLDGVDYFAGTHVAPDNSADDGDITPGTYGSLATCKYDVYFRGKSAHAGGFPEMGRNAVLAAGRNFTAQRRDHPGQCRQYPGRYKQQRGGG